jgi:iron complex outermembrane receptor protein
MGQFNLGLETSYLISRKQDGVETVGQYLQFGPVNRTKNSVGLDWAQGGWTADVAYRWQSGYRDSGDTRDVGSYEIFDVSAAYRGIKNLTVRVGIQNLFDRNPPYSRQGDYFQVGFDPTYTDPRGRTFSLAVKYAFQ